MTNSSALFCLQIQEWHERAAKLEEMSQNVNRLFERLTFCVNRELLYDLYPYVWDMRGVISLLNSYVRWLGKYHPLLVLLTYTKQQGHASDVQMLCG